MSLAVPVMADEITDPNSPSVPPPARIEDIGFAADILPGSAEFLLLPPAAQELLISRPGAMAAVVNGRVTALYGVPLATGATAAEAAAAFWAQYGAAFAIDAGAGIPPGGGGGGPPAGGGDGEAGDAGGGGLIEPGRPDLLVTRSHEVGHGKFTVYAYQQNIGGLPVEYATARLLVSHADAAEARVTWVSGKFAQPSPEGPGEVWITGEVAVGIVATMPSFAYLGNWTTPELVVYAGKPEEFGPVRFGWPVKAWKFSAEVEGGARGLQAMTFFVNATNGELEGVRSDIAHYDIPGKIEGLGTPIVRQGQPWGGPYDPNDPLTITNLGVAGFRAALAGGGSAYTNGASEYLLPYSGGYPVNVSTGVTDGQWFHVFNSAGSELTQTISVPNSSTPGDFLSLNDPPTVDGTAQINAFVYAHQARELFTSRMSWTGLDYAIQIAVNDGYGDIGACNAYTFRNLIRINPAELPPSYYSVLCPNIAYSSAVMHEYGHFVQQQLGIAQISAFSEGFSDVVSVFGTDDPFQGRGLPPEIARDYRPAAAPASYPCAGESHACGRVLAGFWRDIRVNLGAQNTTVCQFAATGDDALAFIRQLFVDWAQITNGGLGDANSAHPLTVREINAVIDGYGCSDAAAIKSAVCDAAIRHSLATQNLGSGMCKLSAGTPPPGVVAFRPPIMWYSSMIHPGGAPDGFDPSAIAIADFDGDGFKDVALACNSRPNESGNPACVIVMWGASSGSNYYTFDATPTVISLSAGGPVGRMATADLGGTVSGRPDLVITVPGQNALEILYYNGSRTFSSSGLISPESDEATPRVVQYPQGVTAGDFDADGQGDVAVAGTLSISGANRPVLAVLWNSGTGGFVKRSYWATSFTQNETGPGGAVTTFVDSGGHIGFAITNLDTNIPDGDEKVYSFVRASGGPRDRTATSNGGRSSPALITINVDTDTLQDLVGTAAGTGVTSSTWYRHNADSTVTNISDENGALLFPASSLSGGKLSKRLTLPLALDATYDVASVSPPASPTGNGDVYMQILLNSGAVAPRFFTQLLAASINPYDLPFPSDVAIVDFNGDGFPDIVCAHRGKSSATNNPPVDLHEGFSLHLSRGNP